MMRLRDDAMNWRLQGDSLKKIKYKTALQMIALHLTQQYIRNKDLHTGIQIVVSTWLGDHWRSPDVPLHNNVYNPRELKREIMFYC